MTQLRHVLFIIVGLFASAALFWWTATALPWVSAFSAALLKAFIAFGLLAAFVYFGLDIDSKVEMKQIRGKPIAVAIIILALAILLAPAVASGQGLLHTAKQHVGVQEVGDNGGKMVEKYLESVGLGEGYPWCAAFVRYVMDAADVARPPVRSAGATDYITGRSVDAKRVLRGTADVPEGALSIHRRGQTWKGHIGIVRYWQRQCGGTIEGNTSPGNAGPQRDGQGVWKRTRCIHAGSYFRIVAFTPTS